MRQLYGMTNGLFGEIVELDSLLRFDGCLLGFSRLRTFWMQMMFLPEKNFSFFGLTLGTIHKSHHNLDGDLSRDNSEVSGILSGIPRYFLAQKIKA